MEKYTQFILTSIVALLSLMVVISDPF